MLTIHCFFKRKHTSVKNALNDIESFSNFSGLRPNLRNNWNRSSEKCKCGTL